MYTTGHVHIRFTVNVDIARICCEKLVSSMNPDYFNNKYIYITVLAV